MCGINGVIQTKELLSHEQLEKLIHVMNESIIHRGPDSEGVYVDDICALGMRRLSIIDLGSGRQPIWNETHDKVIVFNGEIYNYKDIKETLLAKGHVFATNTDTEVILHGYEEYGVNILKKLEGMFAFAIYDVLTKKWLIARDRAGEKPLYYYKNDGKIIFGSELKSLIATGLIPKKIDGRALGVYFQLTYIPAPYCIIENVQKLEAASYLVIDEVGNIQKDIYWGIDLNNKSELNYETAKKRLREAVFSSVEKCMNSDVPLGAFLSGGFDSSIVVGTMSQISDKPINTFTIGFDEKEYDESELAGIVAKANGTKHRVLTLDWNTALDDIETILNNVDEPFADSSLIATYEVSKMTRERVKVALTGDAGDELFAGYDKYLIDYYRDKYLRVPSIIRNGLIEPGSKLIPVNSSIRRKVDKVVRTANMSSFEARKNLMCLGFKQKELECLLSSNQSDEIIPRLEFVEKDFNRFSEVDEQKRAQYVDLRTVLEGDMLAKVDRASMLASLETRVPLLSKDIIELAFSLPTEYKIQGKRRKIILKDAFADLLPEELYHAPKSGFRVPIGEWLSKELLEKLNRYASKEFVEEQGLFEWEYINSLINEHIEKRSNRSSELWTFYVFQNWYERMICS